MYIWAAAIGEVLVCREPTNEEIFFLYSHKIFSYIFFVQKYFYNEIKANYGTCFIHDTQCCFSLMFRLAV